MLVFYLGIIDIEVFCSIMQLRFFISPTFDPSGIEREMKALGLDCVRCDEWAK